MALIVAICLPILAISSPLICMMNARTPLAGDEH
jgi:hypothetical protein